MRDMRLFRRYCAISIVLLVLLHAASAASYGVPDIKRIERLTGAKATFIEREQVVKVSYPRTDLSVVVDGVSVTPAMGLTSWAAFRDDGTGKTMMVTGDIVMPEDEVNDTLAVALNGGLDVTAIHNHFMWDIPRVMFMHIEGRGEEKALASVVGRIFEIARNASDTTADLPAPSSPSAPPIDPAPIEEVLGSKAEISHDTLKFTFGKITRLGGVSVGPSMGVSSWAAFTGTDDTAAVAGDFAAYDDEMQPVLKALNKAGINIVAVHNHFLGDDPHVMFLHYWAKGPAIELAKGIKAALAAQRQSRLKTTPPEDQ